MQTLDIIYIAGSGRSGTTVLDRVLGTCPGTASFNEVYQLLTEGMADNNFCACGERFRACKFWQKMVADVFPEPGDDERVRVLLSKYDHTRHVLRLLLFPYGRKYRRELGEYRQWLSKLYFALARESDVSVLIDSSKVPSRALLLSQLPGVRVHVVHLVRDVRAVSNAWTKEKYNPATRDRVPVYSSVRSVLFWYARQLMTELLRLRASYTRILYEEFVVRPNEVLKSVWTSIESMQGASLPFEKDGSINLKSLHSIGGNPGRYSTGPTFLLLDKEWQKTMPLATQRLVKFLGFPLLWRYGYLGLNTHQGKDMTGGSS